MLATCKYRHTPLPKRPGKIGAIIFLNLTGLPMMVDGTGSGTALAHNHIILPSIILGQTLLSFALMWFSGHRRGDVLAAGEGRSQEEGPVVSQG